MMQSLEWKKYTGEAKWGVTRETVNLNWIHCRSSKATEFKSTPKKKMDILISKVKTRCGKKNTCQTTNELAKSKQNWRSQKKILIQGFSNTEDYRRWPERGTIKEIPHDTEKHKRQHMQKIQVGTKRTKDVGEPKRHLIKFPHGSSNQKLETRTEKIPESNLDTTGMILLREG